MFLEYLSNEIRVDIVFKQALFCIPASGALYHFQFLSQTLSKFPIRIKHTRISLSNKLKFIACEPVEEWSRPELWWIADLVLQISCDLEARNCRRVLV